MTARAVFSEARLHKLLAACREQGFQPTTVRVERDGAIEVKLSDGQGQTISPVDAVKW